LLLIVGLGNPGREYEETRHNVGFMLIDRLASDRNVKLKRSGAAFIGKGTVGGIQAVLMKPLTYMNLSGEAVARFSDFFSIPVESIVVAHDDCDLPLGRIRLKKNGGSGGHKGIISITERLGSPDFQRVRLGIGRPEHGDVADYVLSRFRRDEGDLLEEMLIRGIESVDVLASSGIDAAMNRFNALK
jgi:peptidyl-tRNA hydrolase, PTH1 family